MIIHLKINGVSRLHFQTLRGQFLSFLSQKERIFQPNDPTRNLSKCQFVHKIHGTELFGPSIDPS